MKEKKKSSLTKEEINNAVEEVFNERVKNERVAILYCYDVESMKYFSKAFKEAVEKWKSQK